MPISAIFLLIFTITAILLTVAVSIVKLDRLNIRAKVLIPCCALAVASIVVVILSFTVKPRDAAVELPLDGADPGLMNPGMEEGMLDGQMPEGFEGEGDFGLDSPDGESGENGEDSFGEQGDDPENPKTDETGQDDLEEPDLADSNEAAAATPQPAQPAAREQVEVAVAVPG